MSGASALAEERARRLVIVVDGLDEDQRELPRLGDSQASPPCFPGVLRLVSGSSSPAALVPVCLMMYLLITRYVYVTPGACCVVGRLRCGKARRAGTTRPARRRSDRDRRGGLCRGVRRRPDQKRPVCARRGPPYMVDPFLAACSAVASRPASPSISGRPAAPAGPGLSVCARDLAGYRREQLGNELVVTSKNPQLDRVLHRCSWPDNTPGYAVRGYLRLLTATSDETTLSALARDPTGTHSFSSHRKRLCRSNRDKGSSR